MARKPKQQWLEGDYFCVPLVDGTYAVGQVIGIIPNALNSVLCVFFSQHFHTPPSAPQSEVSVLERDLISALFVTRELLDSGRWKVFSNGVPFPIRKYLDIDALEAAHFVGVKVIGAGIIEEFLSAYYALLPWNDYFKPDYLDGLLISPDRKPKHLLYK